MIRRRRPIARFPAPTASSSSTRVDSPADAAVVLECSDVTRPDVAGLDRYFLVNVDHHVGNAHVRRGELVR